MCTLKVLLHSSSDVFSFWWFSVSWRTETRFFGKTQRKKPVWREQRDFTLHNIVHIVKPITNNLNENGKASCRKGTLHSTFEHFYLGSNTLTYPASDNPNLIVSRASIPWCMRAWLQSKDRQNILKTNENLKSIKSRTRWYPGALISFSAKHWEH